MANRDELRSRLKAAAKRRQRRIEGTGIAGAGNEGAIGAPVAPTREAPAAPPADAVGAIVGEVLQYCKPAPCHLDAVVVSSLRGYIKQVEPQREQARGLYQRLSRLASDGRFTPRQFRDAVDQLLVVAKTYDSSNPSDTRFLSYLELLSG